MVTNNDKRDLTLKELTDDVKAQLSRGVGVDGTMHQLLQRGWQEEYARQFVLHAAQSIALETGVTAAEAEERMAGARVGRSRLVYGLAMVVVALGLAGLGLSLTQMGSGFLLFSAGVIFGAFAIVLVLTGLNCWFSNRR